MSYIEDIQSFSPLSLNELIKTAKKYVPKEYKRMPWAYPGLDHGVAILDNEEQLCCYLAAYGEMHKGKLGCAFGKFPFDKIDRNIEIIDWGCGQGLASLYMIDGLRYNNKINRLQKVTLIEPSSAALSRAKLHLQQAVSEDVFIETLNCYLPATNPTEQLDIIGGLHIEEPICVHLFSNILDIPSIDLKELAYLVDSSGYIHYFICVGPVNFGNDRLAAFPKYFNIQKNNVFIDFKSGQYKQLENGKWYSCVAKGFQLIR